MMHLCLDVGNSHIFGGVFLNNKVIFTFRYDSKQVGSSDQLGLFLKSVLRENDLDPKEVVQIAICSVVPAIDYTIRAACVKYFRIDPFILQAGVKTGLKIRYQNPHEVGADRISNAIGAVSNFPNKNIVIFDFGTATTCCVINAKQEYLGGSILPGFRTAMLGLQQNAAKLFPVDIVRPEVTIGRSTRESMQAGIYYSQLGAAKILLEKIKQFMFPKEDIVTIATGGFSHLLQDENIFNIFIPDLVLHGLNIALELNQSKQQSLEIST